MRTKTLYVIMAELEDTISWPAIGVANNVFERLEDAEGALTVARVDARLSGGVEPPYRIRKFVEAE